MEQSNADDPEVLQRGQQRQLSALLRWSAREVPHYRHLKALVAKLKRLDTRPEQFWQAWRNIPVLTKPQLRSEVENLLARHLPDSHQPMEIQRTSGSTGIPVQVASTRINETVWDALTIREHLWHRRDFSRRLGVIRYRKRPKRSPTGHCYDSWGPPVDRVYKTGPASVIHIGYPIDQVVDWLQDFDPHYLLTHPSIMEPLLDVYDGRGAGPRSLEEVRFIAEPLGSSLVQTLASRWHVRCSDVYSSNETGIIAFQCRERGKLHVQSEAVLVEIVDDRGRLCSSGQSGRVIISMLHNLAMPIIRYEIGDYATVGEPCECGRPHPVIEKVLGRVRNLVTTPKGERFWPVALGRMRTVSSIQQVQFVQVALDRIEVRVRLERPLTLAEEKSAIDITRDVLGYPFHVDIKPVDAIERGPSGKFEEFLSLVDEPD